MDTYIKKLNYRLLKYSILSVNKIQIICLVKLILFVLMNFQKL